jgi:4-alpha-glucanotransferase
MPRSRRPALRALADRLGILPSYVDLTGIERPTSDHNFEAIAAAMGYDASSEAAARAALERFERAERERPVDRAVVVVGGELASPVVTLRLPEGARGRIAWEAELATERGERWRAAGAAAARDGALRVRLPGLAEHGYHTLRLRLALPGGPRDAVTTLIAAPDTCWSVGEALGERRAFGLWCNLYAVRSGTNWGVGDLGDLRHLARWAGRAGAEFFGVNPLHATWNRGHDISPYSPVSRLWRNAVYLDVTAVPELADAPEARAVMDEPGFRSEQEALRASELVEYERVMALKRRVLEPLHRAFRERHGAATTKRGRDYAAWVEGKGKVLLDFAVFMAIDERVTREHGRPVWWREWPEPLRDPRGDGVARFRREHADEVDFWCWLQFELDRQLGEAAREAREAGMAIGLYQDLAVGSSGGGSDAWSFGELFCGGATIGAPPDPFAEQGQDWGFPPLDPNRLAADGFRYWIHLVRSTMRHAGALRIDHAFGLRRLFWIPTGRTALEGAYVRYPERELLAILALESRRHRALVVAEDLGTEPPGFASLLERWGVLSSRLLFFEWEDGGFKPAARYSPRALVTTTTHDHTPLATWWGGDDIAIRDGLGVLGRTAGEAWRERARAKAALRERLAREGGLAMGDAEPGYPDVLEAAHRFLASTPAPLLGLSLEDLTAERSPVNVPGVGPDKYPVWRRRLGLSLEQIERDATVRRGLEGAGARGRERS